MSTATAPAVHVQIPYLEGHALFEGAVNWSACSAVGVECAVAGRQQRTPDAGNARAIWAAMKANAETTGNGTGASMPDVVWALNERGYHNLDVLYASAGLEPLHQLLKDAGVAGDPVILLVTNGQALPDNEAGVHGHFVVSAGIDSARGYLILNGDTRTAIANQAHYLTFPACGQAPTNWATWSTLVAAQLYAAVRVKASAPAATPAPTPAPTPEPAPQTPATPPQVAQARSDLQQASSAIQAALTALAPL